jgi:acyl carrier protein
MENTPVLRQEIKRLMVENLMLQLTPEEIADNQPLFGPGSVGLDSVDALQLVVALDKAYGLKIADSDVARRTLHSVDTMAAAVVAHKNSAA